MPAAGVAVTVTVYAPRVVPGLPPPLLPHPVTTAATIKSAAASVTMPRRFRDVKANRNIHARAAPVSLIKSQLGPCGRFKGLNKPLLAVEFTMRVALPVSDPALNVMVAGPVKFESGAPKLQLGKSVALGGAWETPQLKVTEPLNPFAPATVMRHVPD